MGKQLLFITLTHLAAYGMHTNDVSYGASSDIADIEKALSQLTMDNREHNESAMDIGQILAQHQWHERLHALMPHQSRMLSLYISRHRPSGYGSLISKHELCQVLIDGLNTVEHASSCYDDEGATQAIDIHLLSNDANILELLQRNFFKTIITMVNKGNLTQQVADDIMEVVVIKLSRGNTDPDLLHIITCLLDKGYEVNNVWHFTTHHSDTLLVLLLQCGANPNYIFTDRYHAHIQWTPLLCAIHNKNIAAIQMLLDKGALINFGVVQFGRFENPLLCARRMPNQAIANYLESRGGRMPNA